MNNIAIPSVKKKPHKVQIHNHTLIDDYDWLRDRNWPNVQDPNVLEYLNKENEYADAFFDQYADLKDQLVDEMKARIKEDDESYPTKKDDYFYYSYIKKGQDHRVYARKHLSLDAKQEIVLDSNILAKQADGFVLGSMSIDKRHNNLLYATNYDGNEKYNIYIKDLVADTTVSTGIDDAAAGVVWHESVHGFFYQKVDKNFRSNTIYFRDLRAAGSQDKLVFEEKDPRYHLSFSKSADKTLLFIETHGKEDNEAYYIDLQKPDFTPKLIVSRKKGVVFDIDKRGELLFILTNDQGHNFRLVTRRLDDDHQFEIIGHSQETILNDFALYREHLVVAIKQQGNEYFKIFKFTGDEQIIAEMDVIKFDHECYSAAINYTDFDDEYLRFSYSSMIMPYSIIEYNFATQQRFVRKTQEIPSGYDQSQYETKRLYSVAADGFNVPISVVYKKDTISKGAAPLLLYGYGSYGMEDDPSFGTNILSLLDRGFIFAIAHIRGGGFLGREQYLSGKLLNKKNSFTDFISVAEHLIDKQYTTADLLSIRGGSAGGMLIGNVINQRPELFHSAVAEVPFVDVINTMMDSSLPLTPGEYDEWGNPENKEYFEYMLSYSPYENVKKQAYPHLLIRGGLTDPRVTYWEPAKWAAKLRDYKTNDNKLFLKIDMNLGHFGKSGRYKVLEEIAEYYIFLLKV